MWWFIFCLIGQKIAVLSFSIQILCFIFFSSLNVFLDFSFDWLIASFYILLSFHNFAVLISLFFTQFPPFLLLIFIFIHCSLFYSFIKLFFLFSFTHFQCIHILFFLFYLYLNFILLRSMNYIIRSLFCIRFKFLIVPFIYIFFLYSFIPHLSPCFLFVFFSPCFRTNIVAFTFPYFLWVFFSLTSLIINLFCSFFSLPCILPVLLVVFLTLSSTLFLCQIFYIWWYLFYI